MTGEVTMVIIKSTVKVGQKPFKEDMNRQKRRQAVTIRIQPDVSEKYKSLGNGYTGIMADVLRLAADNPEILQQIRGNV